MGNNNLNWIANFIWGIADDVLRDVYVRGKYRDVILPMVVIRRLDAVLEPRKISNLPISSRLILLQRCFKAGPSALGWLTGSSGSIFSAIQLTGPAKWR
jgi:hypothetical protein